MQLFLNGKSLGYGAQSSHFLFTFKDVLWQPGTLKAVGYDANDKPLWRNAKNDVGCSRGLTIDPHRRSDRLEGRRRGPRAGPDRSDRRRRRRRCPTALNTVRFALSGPAEWRGGLAQDDARPDNFILSQTLPVEGGVNRVLLRALPRPGTITLRATSPGLTAASATPDHAPRTCHRRIIDDAARRRPRTLSRPRPDAQRPVVHDDTASHPDRRRDGGIERRRCRQKR